MTDDVPALKGKYVRTATYDPASGELTLTVVAHKLSPRASAKRIVIRGEGFGAVVVQGAEGNNLV